ncbi:MAG: peptidylprolyl isomerase [Gammaproteobacteria bacterium]|nr:peptidylprolyl isomerase [Gammaproteobacteria bacterium]
MPDQIVAKNKHVLFSYTIVDADTGDLLEQVEIPMGYIHGGEQRMFGKVEKAMEGAAIGDDIEVTLESTEAFGEADQGLIFTDSMENVPPQFHHVGAEVEFQNERDEIKSFTVTRVEDGLLTIDGNSPLVGKKLRFKLTIHDIRDATEKEVNNGRPFMRSLH